MKYKIGHFALGMYQTNCYYVYKEGEQDCIVFDPADSGEFICDKLLSLGLKVKGIYLTHGHFDHIYGVKELKKRTGALVGACEAEEELLAEPDINCSSSVGRPESIKPDVFFKDNEVVENNGFSFKVIHTPGHTKGSCCYYFEEDGFLIGGDTLFCESVGRSDLPTGNGRELVNFIKEKLLCLPGKTVVYPGHGPSTTIDNEKSYNPFL